MRGRGGLASSWESPARRREPGGGTNLIRATAALLLALVVATVAPNASGSRGGVQVVYRIDRVTDGDTVVLRNGQRVRLVQIDTPEVFFGTECYGRQASATTKRLLPEGTRVRLLPEPATDRVDDFGRLLRYVVRVSDGVNVNLALVALGAGAPWFYERSSRPVRVATRTVREERDGEAPGALAGVPENALRPVLGHRDAAIARMLGSGEESPCWCRGAEVGLC